MRSIVLLVVVGGLALSHATMVCAGHDRALFVLLSPTLRRGDSSTRQTPDH